MMATYTVQVTVKVSANSADQAYWLIRRELAHRSRPELVYVDAEVVDTAPDPDDDPDAQAEWGAL